MNFRIKLIQLLVAINERIFFYPKLKNFYKTKVKISNPIIFDIGVNKGQSIDFFTTIYKNIKIYGFEPNPELYQKLVLQYPDKNISLYNKGISNQNDKLTFYKNVMDETSSFELLNYESEYLKKKSRILGVDKSKIISEELPIDVITLSDFIAEHKIEYIDILKIDTEGHELQCLEGLFSKMICSVDIIQLEQHEDDMYLSGSKQKEIENILEEYNYTQIAKFKHGFGNFYEVIYSKSHKL